MSRLIPGHILMSIDLMRVCWCAPKQVLLAFSCVPSLISSIAHYLLTLLLLCLVRLMQPTLVPEDGGVKSAGCRNRSFYGLVQQVTGSDLKPKLSVVFKRAVSHSYLVDYQQ